ncbi:hypothetical protein SAMN02910456_02204 [Ruminococcaceae bacterium YRB3002]|nr:hypothetical protein SAMN02910456_02204 [Ruminococcaceae bacterium YRB3002]
MQCPICGSQCRDGVVQALDPRYLIISWPAKVRWFPAEYEDKIIKKEKIYLDFENKGYLCEHCHKVFTAYDVEYYDDVPDEDPDNSWDEE